MTQLFKNNASGSLASSIGTTDTLLALATGHGARFPTPSGGDHFQLTLVGLDVNGNEASWEIVRCTARSNDSLTVVRAQEGTSAQAWPAGARVELRVTAGTLDSFTVTSGYASKTVATNTTLAADTEYETGRNLRINHGVNLDIPASTKLIVRKYAAGSSL